MFGTEIINSREYLSCMGYVLMGEEWKRTEDMTENIPQEKAPRTIKQLVRDFERSAGDFEKFNSRMDLREQTLFKGWLLQLRSEIPKFAGHAKHSY
jgi:hypothetical protein